MAANPKRAKQLGRAVREARTAAGLSQMALAERAGVSLTFAGELERGEKGVTVDTIIGFAKALGMTGADLLRRAGL